MDDPVPSFKKKKKVKKLSLFWFKSFTKPF